MHGQVVSRGDVGGMTDFWYWADRVEVDCEISIVSAQRRGVRLCALLALTEDGLIPVSCGPDVASLTAVPLDHLFIGPAALGGMVACSDGDGFRLIVRDGNGRSEVLEGNHGAWQRVEVELADLEVVALLGELMDLEANHPPVAELEARLLVWGWLGHTARRVDSESIDPGLRLLVDGDLPGLANLMGIDSDRLPPSSEPLARLGQLAELVGHPALEWPVDEPPIDVEAQITFLHACIPSRWVLADELRSIDRRIDLADLVMAAALPGRAPSPS